MQRLLLVLAGLTGAAGVMIYASAAHVAGPGDPDRFALANAAIMMLTHAGAGLGLAVLSTRTPDRWRWPAIGLVVVGGAALFGLAVALPKLAGFSLPPMSAPTGGTIAILGWVLVAINGVFGGFGNDVET